MTDTNAVSPPRISDSTLAIARLLASPRTSTGTLATLSRFRPDEHLQQCVLETTRVLHEAQVPWREHDFIRWAMVVHCLALIRGKHDATPPGVALHRAQVSESRVRQLLQADAPLLFDLMPRIARRLRASGQGANWGPLARMVLFADVDEARANSARADVAAGFVGATAPGAAPQQDPAAAGALTGAEGGS